MPQSGFAEDWEMLYVVHLIREDEELGSIRIISARAATRQERDEYENH